MIIMEWTTKNVTVKAVSIDADLHEFVCYNHDGKLLGTITPGDLDDMNNCIKELNEGGCPIADRWEDGMGNTCTIEGWGEDDN
jgi:hypothetical protein